MGRRRTAAESRAGAFFRLIENGGICIYCGVPATTIDHFAPLSVVSAGSGILDTVKGRFLVPACGECNSIANSAVFPTIGAKRRYIQQRLRKKYATFLNMPYWSEDEIAELGHTLRTNVRNGLATKEWIIQRLAWQNRDNPSAVKIAEIRLKLGVLGKFSALRLANNSGTTTTGRRRTG